MSELVIEAKGLTKRFNEKVLAVDGVDLAIPRGEIFGLLGPNGAGKTTTLSMLVTIQRPTGGLARVAGIDVARDPAQVRKRVGIVFQEPSLDSILTARENLELHGRLYGVPLKELKPRIQEMLQLVNLEKRADDLVKTFSGGMKRRLEIARGLMHQPEVLFLDEPTLGLDPATREHIWEYIRSLRDTRGTTVVLTTHYMEEADSLCDRIAIIDHGKIVALGTPAELKRGLGGDTVVLRARKADVASLRALPCVSSLDEKDGVLTLRVKDAPANLSAIVTAAGEVQSIDVRTPRLEDVFLALTGKDFRDAEEDGGFMADYLRTQQGR
jgi:ABC-2 type transport system ATP-binding protein